MKLKNLFPRALCKIDPFDGFDPNDMSDLNYNKIDLT